MLQPLILLTQSTPEGELEYGKVRKRAAFRFSSPTKSLFVFFNK